MKLPLINGSPNQKGCTCTALCENGIQTEIFHSAAGGPAFRYKPAAAVVSCRRGGATEPRRNADYALAWE